MQITLLTHDAMLANSVALMLASSALGRLSRAGDDVTRLAKPDVLILDANLPRRLMRALRRRVAEWDKPVPTLLLTSGDRAPAVPNGFETADVLEKPFHQRDLVARIHATQTANDGDIHVGRLSLDTAARRASVDGERVPLTRKEYEVLEFLATHKGTTLTKEMFLDRLYGGIDEPEIKIIDVFICKIRRKLKALTGGDPLIATVWGRGYVLRDPATLRAAAVRRQAAR